MGLYEMLAEAYAQPSRGYRTAIEASDAIGNIDKGFQVAKEREDAERVRRLKQQTLGTALGGQGLEGILGMTGETGEIHNPTLRLMAALESKKKREQKERTPGSLGAILAGKVQRGEMSIKDAFKLQNQGMLLRTGYEDTPDGLYPVPGGKPAREINDAAIQKENARRERGEKAKFVVSKTNEALNNMGPTAVGTLGSVSRAIPFIPTKAKDLTSTIDTIKASVSFDALQDMRNNSPTGAALGPVSDRENTLLAAAAGSLETEQTPPQLAANIKEIRKRYSNIQLLIENQTGDHEADEAIGRVVSSDVSEQEKRARIQGIRATAGR